MAPTYQARAVRGGTSTQVRTAAPAAPHRTGRQRPDAAGRFLIAGGGPRRRRPGKETNGAFLVGALRPGRRVEAARLNLFIRFECVST